MTLGSDQLPDFLRPAFAKRHVTRERLSQEVWRPPQTPGETRRFLRFLEVWPFVDDFWRHELEGRSENRLRVVADVQAEDEPFAAAQFGRYSTDGPTRYLRERLGAEAVTYNADWWQQFEFGKWLFPIHLTQLSLSSYGQAAFFNAALYLCNPADLFDVIDYWNLRAAGMTVFPLPAPRYKEYAGPAQTFIAATKREVPEGFEGAEGQIIKARSVTDELLKEVASWASEATKTRITQHGWYPRFGMRWQPYMSRDISPVRVEASSSNVVVVIDGKFGHLLGSTPPCEFVGDARQQQWSSELQVYGDRAEEYMHQVPWLNPECDHVVNRHLGHGFDEKASRASRTGLINHRVGDARDTAIELIPVSDIVTAVLRNSGLKFIGRSSNGLAAERIAAQLGSIYGCSIFQHRGVREVLQYLERGEKSLPAAEIMAKLKKLNRPTPFSTPDMTALMDKLVAKQVLRPGLVFQCSSCGRNDWYHISAFDERFECKWCFTDQRCPRVETLKWHYRTDGLFALEGKMGGSISVLLAILQIKLHVHDTVHYYPSFEYKEGDQAHEVDFMCFVKDRSDQIEIVVGEAKSGGNDLKDDEVARMEDLARRLDAWVVFCTLGTFSDSDKEHFKRLRRAEIGLILLDGTDLEMFGDDILNQRSVPGYTEYGSELATLSGNSTNHVIGPPEQHR